MGAAGHGGIETTPISLDRAADSVCARARISKFLSVSDALLLDLLSVVLYVEWDNEEDNVEQVEQAAEQVEHHEEQVLIVAMVIDFLEAKSNDGADDGDDQGKGTDKVVMESMPDQISLIALEVGNEWRNAWDEHLDWVAEGIRELDELVLVVSDPPLAGEDSHEGKYPLSAASDCDNLELRHEISLMDSKDPR